MTTLEITPALVSGTRPQLDLLGGAALLFSREPGGEMDLKTPAANAALRGTRFSVQATESGRCFFQGFEATMACHGGVMVPALAVALIAGLRPSEIEDLEFTPCLPGTKKPGQDHCPGHVKVSSVLKPRCQDDGSDGTIRLPEAGRTSRSRVPGLRSRRRCRRKE